jgi:hypothetical protein
MGEREKKKISWVRGKGCPGCHPLRQAAHACGPALSLPLHAAVHELPLRTLIAWRCVCVCVCVVFLCVCLCVCLSR